jgi:hypothetical protein
MLCLNNYFCLDVLILDVLILGGGGVIHATHVHLALLEEEQ